MEFETEIEQAEVIIAFDYQPEEAMVLESLRKSIR